jgi:hypothetical protein
MPPSRGFFFDNGYVSLCSSGVFFELLFSMTPMLAALLIASVDILDISSFSCSIFCFIFSKSLSAMLSTAVGTWPVSESVSESVSDMLSDVTSGFGAQSQSPHAWPRPRAWPCAACSVWTVPARKRWWGSRAGREGRSIACGGRTLYTADAQTGPHIWHSYCTSRRTLYE